MFERIGEEGLVISEWPPDAPPYKLRFLIRNRADRRGVGRHGAGGGGATAAAPGRRSAGPGCWAGRRWWCPGPVTSAMSVGCHEELRRRGPRAVASVAHVIEEVGRIGVDLAPLPATPGAPARPASTR